MPRVGADGRRARGARPGGARAPRRARPRSPASAPGGAFAFACLGTSGAVPSALRDTTALVVRRGQTACLVDVGGSPVQKLRRLGVDPVHLAAVVVTHTHPDHVYGLPALVQNLLILGRRAPLPVYCRAEHAATIRGLLELFGLVDRPGGLAVPVTGLAAREGLEVLRTPDLVVSASPNAHGPMPNLAVRVDAAGRSLVYSSDTRPCPEVRALARGASVLVHEATFRVPDPTQWHSTARDAAEVARAAGVGRLLLAHVGHEHHRALGRVLADARTVFAGRVEVARELAWYRI